MIDKQVSVTEENHDEFNYNIKVKATEQVKAAFRIFIAPRFDVHGNQMELATQRRMCIEMDKFVQTCRSPAESAKIKCKS